VGTNNPPRDVTGYPLDGTAAISLAQSSASRPDRDGWGFEATVVEPLPIDFSVVQNGDAMALNGARGSYRVVQGLVGHDVVQDLAVSWLASRPGGDKRRQGGGVARIVFRRVIVAASAVTNFAELAPALTERLRRWPARTQL